MPKKMILVFFLIGLSINGEAKKMEDQNNLKKKLTPMQYQCTQENATEMPFKNAYWNNHQDGIYTDVVSGVPLFSSLHKFDSGSGWPSFDRPLKDEKVSLKNDFELGMKRVEVRSSKANSHLGHVFDDGPKETTGKRFCINSASLSFIPLEKLKENGLGEYLFSFKEKKHWEIATLAGGCFWGMEELIRKMPGVIETHVGYTGGKVPNAHYEIVKTGTTGHAESIQILFDPKLISYEQILLEFFKLHDPTTKNQQGNDQGTQYRSAVFTSSESQRATAQKVIERVDKSHAYKGKVVTEISPLGEFYLAEDYHQKYLEKKPSGYTCHFIRPITF
jgi:peptide methionine sulfoxide reductase msrA/msrB